MRLIDLPADGHGARLRFQNSPVRPTRRRDRLHSSRSQLATTATWLQSGRRPRQDGRRMGWASNQLSKAERWVAVGPSKARLLLGAMVGVPILLGGCGASSPASPTQRPAPTVPSDGGLAGTWTYADASQVVTIRFDTKGTSDAAKAAEACRAGVNGAPVLWVMVSAENKTGDHSSLGIVTIVSGDGHQYESE